MANLTGRLPENACARYDVDVSCIDGDPRHALAPQIYSRRDDRGFSIVWQQSEIVYAMSRVGKIMAGHATGSIGNDGA